MSVTERLTIRDLPRAEWEALRLACFERDDGACRQCNSTDELQADHIRPIVDWPELALDLSNLQTLCGPCNRAKSDSAGEVTVRLAWLNPTYPEIADLVFPTA